jgi:lysophospholipase L1-like esterase
LRVLGWVRDAWLILGLAILLLAAVEMAYRATLALGSHEPGAEPDSTAILRMHPYAREPWWPEWRENQRRQDESLSYGFDGYRGYWARPFQSTWLNIDSAGVRRTVQPDPGPRARRVLMLGGSTMWGYTVRDSHTIPSLLAAELRARGIDDVEVVNLAQSGFNVMQNVITLLLELRRGAPPAAVVFFDGHNDIASGGAFAEAGHILWQEREAWLFERGRRLPPDMGRLASRLLVVGHAERAFARRFGSKPPPLPAPRPTAPLEQVCRDIGSQYRNQIRDVSSLGKDRGFEALFFWQPMLATTRKPLTPFEKTVHDRPYEPQPGWPDYREMLRRCSEVVESMMGDERGTVFFSLATLFDNDTSTVFLDDYGHLTEDADARVAAAIADILVPKLAPAPRPDPSVWTVTPTGIGPLRAGMSVAEARSVLGADFAVDDSAGSCQQVPLTGLPGRVLAMVVDGRVVRVEVRAGPVATSAGARVGDSEARIDSLYAGRVRMEPHKYTEGHDLVVTSEVAADSSNWLIFETDGGKVLQYRAGLVPAVAWIEGCS